MMKSMSTTNTSVLVFLSAIICIVLTCQPPDCDRPDCGSCGNACCMLQFTMFSQSPKDAYTGITKSLQGGGADGRYTLIHDADYTSANISAQYVIQGWHTTLTHHYNDTMNLVIYANPEGPKTSSRVSAFSTSQIGGALCDAGQNYKNLVGFVKGLKVPYASVAVHGCNNPNP